MSSSDVRDVLNIPEGGGAPGGPRPSKKQRLSAPRPNLKGLAREVHALGGDSPISIVPEVTAFKKRRLASRKPAARWDLAPFRNSARDDPSLVLRHWKRRQPRASGPETAAAATTADGQQAPSADGAAAATATEGTKTEDGQQQTEAKAEDMDDSAFAKYNVHVSIPQYTDEQYRQCLTSDDWTREETDYLMGLAADFDLRWPIIWDRYEWTKGAEEPEDESKPAEETADAPKTEGEGADTGAQEAAAADKTEEADKDKKTTTTPPSSSTAIVKAQTDTRTLEDLKARYYDVAAKMMAQHKPVHCMSQAEFALHEMMAHFNPQQERARKEFALNALSRSREEAREEEALLLEVKRILARSERFNEERRELYNRLDYPHAETDINSFKSSAGLQTLLQNLMTADKSKKRKSLMAAAAAANGGDPSAAAAAAAAAAAGAGGAAEGATGGGNRRDSNATSAAATPTTGGNKKAAAAAAAAQQQQAAQQAQQQQAAAAAAALEKPKLTAKEEAIYGVTHHERLGSGPAFRTEKINKLFSHKSNQQQLRINNVLNELDVPAKLAMPTAETTAHYEMVLVAVNALLDARKFADKIDAEVKLELAKKAEREKNMAPPEGAPPEAQQAEEKKEGEGEAQGDKEAAAPEAGAAAAPAAPSEDKDKDKETTAHKRSASVLSGVSDKSAKRQKK